MAEEEVDRFEAEDDDGNIYVVIELQRVNWGTSLSEGTHRARGGSRRLVLLSNGDHVNPVSDGVFQIFSTGKIIRKID